MILNLYGDVSVPMLDDVIEAYNEMWESDDKKMIIYLCSDGGSMSIAHTITNIINENALVTKLIAYDRIESAAFYIFYNTICERDIIRDTYGMMHMTSWMIATTDGGKPCGDSERFKLEHMKANIAYTKKFCNEMGFSEEETKKVLSNSEELFLPYKRIRQILDNQQKNEVHRIKP